jgi:hypothetical protein
LNNDINIRTMIYNQINLDVILWEKYGYS